MLYLNDLMVWFEIVAFDLVLGWWLNDNLIININKLNNNKF